VLRLKPQSLFQVFRIAAGHEQHNAMIEVGQSLWSKYGESSDQEAAFFVATAFGDVAISLSKLGRHEEAVEASRRLWATCRDSPDPRMALVLARCLYSLAGLVAPA
jgi:hypothetical protein